jgi:hypothetical protein
MKSQMLHHALITQQPQRGLGKNIRLGQHGCAGLNQNVLTSKVGALHSNVYILYAAACRRQILHGNG